MVSDFVEVRKGSVREIYLGKNHQEGRTNQLYFSKIKFLKKDGKKSSCYLRKEI